MKILKIADPSVADLTAALSTITAHIAELDAKIAAQDDQAADQLAGDDKAAMAWRRSIAALKEQRDLYQHRKEMITGRVAAATQREQLQLDRAKRAKAESASKEALKLTAEYERRASELAALMKRLRGAGRTVQGFNIAHLAGKISDGVEMVAEPPAVTEGRELWVRVKLPSPRGFGSTVDEHEAIWPPGRMADLDEEAA